MANGGIIGPVNDPTTTTVVTTFTASGTYNYPNQATPGQVDYLVVAGGGGGGQGGCSGGGGGAGGYRTSFPGGTKLDLSGGTSYPVTVGAGGAGSASPSVGTSGVLLHFNLVYSNMVEEVEVLQVLLPGANGGSGGGGSSGGASFGPGGTGNRNSTTSPHKGIMVVQDILLHQVMQGRRRRWSRRSR
jgi:hypothetical protein